MRRNINMLNGPLMPSVIRFSIPVILTIYLQNLFNTADMVVTGQFCGSLEVAGVSATSSLINMFVGLVTGLSLGAGLTVARAMGTRQTETISNAVHTAIPVALIGGLILSVAGVVFAPALLEMMHTPKDVLPLASVYIQIYFSGMLFSSVYNFGTAILRAIGDTKTPLYFLIIAGVLNIILNVIFVAAFHMDVAGVALATVISQAVSAVLVIIMLIHRKDACKFSFKQMRIRRNALVSILQIGLPAGLQSSLFGMSHVITSSAINSFDSAAILSGNGACQSIEVFTDSISSGFSQTISNFVAQNLGARQYNRIKKTYAVCMGASIAFVSVASAVICLFGKQFLGFYITDSAEAISFGLVRMRYLLYPIFLMATMTVSTGGILGLGYSLTSSMINLTTACGFRVVWVYTIFQIPEYHTLGCLYMMYPASWILTTAVAATLFFILLKRKTQTDIPQQTAVSQQ